MKRKTVMPILWIVLGAVVTLALVLFVGGMLVPREHTATCTVELAAPPEQVFATITDWKELPTWNKNVTAVRALEGGNGWVESWGSMTIPLRVEKSEPPRTFVARIVDDGLPFGGTWTHTLEKTPSGGTRLVTTEAGHISAPPFRFLAHFFFGYHRTLNEYQIALGAKFGAKGAPVKS